MTHAPATLRRRDTWLISDTHFFHHNIIDYCGRPFQDVVEMNETLIENWNRVVKPGDRVYHLGDVAMGGSHVYKQLPTLLARLNGSKTLIVGNHDDIPWLSKGAFFRKVEMWKLLTDFGLLLTHVPVHRSAIQERLGPDAINVHGHIHNLPSPEGPYKCVCVEQVHMKYAPIHAEELR